MITPELMVAHHYQRTNNIHSYDGTCWTPIGGGIYEPADCFHDSIVLTGGGGVHIMRWTLLSEPYKAPSTSRFESLAYFERIEDMLDWLKLHGKLSEPGQYQDWCD